MKNKNSTNSFGERLAQLRKTRGLSQTELGNKIGISKRMVAYYEGQTKRPPAHLLIPIAKTLKISVDELLGLKKVKIPSPDHAKLWRRLKMAEQLPTKDQKRLFDFLDLLLNQNKSDK